MLFTIFRTFLGKKVPLERKLCPKFVLDPAYPDLLTKALGLTCAKLEPKLVNFAAFSKSRAS